MNCPLCRDQILEPHHRAGIEIDVCPQCRGVWLDRGELDRLIGNASPSPFMERPDLEDRKPFDASRASHRSEPDSQRSDYKHDDDDDDDDDDRDGRHSTSKSRSKSKSKSKKSSSKKRPPKKKSWGELLGDVLEEVLD